jgi:hypothetical protein
MCHATCVPILTIFIYLLYGQIMLHCAIKTEMISHSFQSIVHREFSMMLRSHLFLIYSS